jgi:hypothetical protein
MVVILAIAYLEVSLSVHSNLARQYKIIFFAEFALLEKSRTVSSNIAICPIFAQRAVKKKVKISFQFLFIILATILPHQNYYKGNVKCELTRTDNKESSFPCKLSQYFVRNV